MSNGSQIYRAIETGLAGLHDQTDTLKGTLQEKRDVLDDAQFALGQAYRGLAALRLEEIDKGKFNDALDQAEKNALELIASSNIAWKSLESEVEEANHDVAAAEIQFDGLAKAISDLKIQIANQETELKESLAGREDYKAQVHAAKSTAQMSENARQKSIHAQNDRNKNRKSYEADPLFMYLWHRGFGTNQYKSWGIAKVLDRWVAGLCGYEVAQSNYAMLVDLPNRLRAHADQLTVDAEQRLADLRAMEENERTSNGNSHLFGQLDQLLAKQVDLDEVQGNAVQKLHDLQHELSKFERAEDDGMIAAYDTIAKELQKESWVKLVRRATLSPDPRDDHLIEQIELLYMQISKFDEAVTTQKENLRVQLQRVAGLQEVRRAFRSKSFHTDDYVFSGNRSLSASLDGVLDGTISHHQYWRELQNFSHYQHQTDYSSSYGSKDHNSSYSSWSSSTRSSDSSQSSGSYSTGGGIESADEFTTGGSF